MIKLFPSWNNISSTVVKVECEGIRIAFKVPAIINDKEELIKYLKNEDNTDIAVKVEIETESKILYRSLFIKSSDLISNITFIESISAFDNL